MPEVALLLLSVRQKKCPGNDDIAYYSFARPLYYEAPSLFLLIDTCPISLVYLLEEVDVFIY